MTVFVFAYFGIGGDALDTYRKWMVKIGLGSCFPGLKEPEKRRQIGSSERSWTNQFNLVSRAKHLDASRKNPNATATTLGTSIDQ